MSNNSSPTSAVEAVSLREGEGERRLLLALVLDAVLEVQGRGRRVAFSSASEKRLSRLRSIRWLQSDDVFASSTRGLSFAWICEHTGLDIDAIRAAAFNKPHRAIRYVSTR